MTVANDGTIYQQLQDEINKRTAIAFPATDSGIEIRILKQIFTPLEAEVAIQLSVFPERIRRIHRRVKKNGLNFSLNELEILLDGLVRKGGLAYEKHLFKKSKKRYLLVQFILGIYEFQIDRISKELAEDTEKYIQEDLFDEFKKTKDYEQLRTVPVNKSIALKRYVGNYDNIQEIFMKEEGPFVVFNCLCRQSKDLQEDPCKISDIRKCCIALNNVATAALELYPSAKEVSKDELLELLDEYRENGFLLQPENCKTPKFMCICCGCCCHALMYLKKLHRPVDYWISNYYAQVNLELCNGCGDCLDRCQLDAITLVNNCSSINLDRCLGCGNCVITCNQKAIILNKKKKPTIPKKSHISLYMSLFLKKRGFFGLLKMLFGYILGYKV